MFYIVALGNPGTEYQNTRHNVGWFLADELRRNFSLTEPVFSAKYQGQISQGTIGGEEVTLLYPETFMNHSGSSVLKLVSNNSLGQMLVLHDDTALPIGQYKISIGRGDGGHNGVRSIIESIKTNDFARLRIGIAPTSFFTGTMKKITGEKLAAFVLGRFSKREQVTLEKTSEKLCEAVASVVTHGVVKAMNKYN